MRKIRILIFLLCLSVFVPAASAQNAVPETKTEPKKTNRRADAETTKTVEPFERADVETMRLQCARLETAAGEIEIEFFPESAPETVRNFLNLAARGFLDATAFSRVVPGFVVQGGNLSTRPDFSHEHAERMRRTITDEPNRIRHERGIVSMARPEEPNGATTHFFILVGDAPHLDGTFAAFGRVYKGMEAVDQINKMPVEGEKPQNPVRLTKATILPCPTRLEP